MPKTDDTFDPADYTPVAERVTQFYARYPNGRIVTRLVKESARRVLFEARVYRSPDEPRPAATGWAAERPGDGMINTVACLENTETSAVGRALANLGLTAGRQRASLEEMVKAARAKQAVARRRSPSESAHSTGDAPPAQRLAPLASDDERLELEELLTEAERRGMPAAEAADVRRLAADPCLTSVGAAGLRDQLGRSLARQRAGLDASPSGGV